MEPIDSVSRLVEIMARLRAPDGCPWDREQTAASLRRYVLEEAYEVAEAIDEGGWASLREELGDLLLQVVFLARIAEEEGAFAFADVAQGIGDKLVRRHPHVFGEVEAGSVEDVWKRWEQIKAGERAAKNGGDEATTSRLDGVPRHLPALAKARLLADKAARAGFDWPDAGAIVDKVEEELRELRQAASDGEGEARVAEELGDVLFACASLARRLGVDGEAALESANRKFTGRFRHVEASLAARGQRFENMTPEALDALWNEAKNQKR